jgi:hypothetical protein
MSTRVRGLRALGTDSVVDNRHLTTLMPRSTTCARPVRAERADERNRPGTAGGSGSGSWRYPPGWTTTTRGRTRTQPGTVLLVVIIIAVIPWRHVFARFVTAPAGPWRRRS